MRNLGVWGFSLGRALRRDMLANVILVFPNIWDFAVLLLSYCNFYLFRNIEIRLLDLEGQVSAGLLPIGKENAFFHLQCIFLFLLSIFHHLKKSGESVKQGVCWGMFSLNKAEEWTMSRMFIIDLTDVFAVCNMNTYGLLVKLESKLHFLLSFLKMKLGLMKGTGFRLWGLNFSVYPGNRYCTSQAEAVELLKISKFSRCLSVLLLLDQLKVPIGKLTLCASLILCLSSGICEWRYTIVLLTVVLLTRTFVCYNLN